MHYIVVEEVLVGEVVTVGMFLVNKHPAIVLFDSGASHSFMSQAFASRHDQKVMEKVYSTPQLWGVVYITPSTMKRSNLPHERSKTVYFTLRRFSAAGCYSNMSCYSTIGFATVAGFCLFLISAESLKNHSKSQKNHKMENLILLDST